MPKKKKLTKSSVKKEDNGKITYEFLKVCFVCGKEYKTTSRKQKYCSPECSEKFQRKSRKLKKQYNKYKEESRILSRAHSLSRAVADLIQLEKKCIVTGSVINLELHHKDGNPLNNSPENLCYLTKEVHSKVHAGLSLNPITVIRELAKGHRQILSTSDQEELLSRLNNLLHS